jgi:hypothetical protein
MPTLAEVKAKRLVYQAANAAVEAQDKLIFDIDTQIRKAQTMREEQYEKRRELMRERINAMEDLDRTSVAFGRAEDERDSQPPLPGVTPSVADPAGHTVVPMLMDEDMPF